MSPLSLTKSFFQLSHRHKIPVKVYTHADYGLLGQQTWYVKDVYIPIVPLDFNIVIKGVVGTDYHSDAAIDDIKIRQGACP